MHIYCRNKSIVTKPITLKDVTLDSHKLFSPVFNYSPYVKKFQIKIADLKDVYILSLSDLALG
jgi:hypothetical protein